MRNDIHKYQADRKQICDIRGRYMKGRYTCEGIGMYIVRVASR